MVLCHVSWAPQAFTWKSGWTFWPSECCWVPRMNIRMLLCSSSECWIFMMFFIWVHHGWMLDEFLGLPSTWCEICLSFILQKVAFPYASSFAGKGGIKYTKSVLDFVQERESSGSATSGPCFKEICLFTAQRSGYLWCKISFALLANFSPTTLFIGWSMRRHEHSDHQNVPFVLTLGWFVRLAFNVINPNSKDTTEVQWMQHLG